MPYYDLKCSDCAHEFNAKASMDERSAQAIRCPSCGSFRLETIFRRVNVVRSRGDLPAECPVDGGGCSGGCCNLAR